jgi:hypothetical protein
MGRQDHDPADVAGHRRRGGLGVEKKTYKCEVINQQILNMKQ